MLKQIDKASIDAVNSGKVIVNKSKKIDERLSAGIICTYGDQASLIKKMRRGQRYEGLSENKMNDWLSVLSMTSRVMSVM